MFDEGSSHATSNDGPEFSTERRAKVRMVPSRDTDQDSLVTNTSSRARVKGRTLRRTRASSSGVQEDSGSIISSWSKPGLVKPLFEFDEASILSVESTRALFQSDDPWQAAKRGDLTALKQFHTSGKVDWIAKDDFRNIPLYYACKSGAITDIMVVPFLLWVTPLRDDKTLEKCRKSAANKQVRSILSAYKKGGLSAIGVEKGSVASVSSRQPSTKVSAHFPFVGSPSPRLNHTHLHRPVASLLRCNVKKGKEKIGSTDRATGILVKGRQVEHPSVE
jgi:hypothetical protein